MAKQFKENETKVDAKNSKRRDWGKTALIVVGIMLFGGIIGGIVLGVQVCNRISQSDVKLPPCESGIVCINAYTVGHDYIQNGLRADVKYKGKTVRISGRISEINRDELGRAFVDLNTGDKGYLVRCYFNARNEDLLLGFNYDDQVWIQGTGAGFTSVGAGLSDIVIFINCDMAQFLNPQQTAAK